MYTNNLVLIGNLVDAPEVQVTQSGAVRASFRIASTERRRDAATDTWQDGESVFVQVTCWRRLAQNVGVSLGKGDRVIVCGRLRQWVADKDGVRRTVYEIEADAVGPDLQRGMASIARPRRADSSADATSPEESVSPSEAPDGSDATGSVDAGASFDTALPEGEATAPADWSPSLAEVGG
ncbi:MAG TPA: single-stranded DNA-binding protein [Frankiaceae bacterium]|nr:single-stranded DNA-binding protein [Frankiaceae bacterium]